MLLADEWPEPPFFFTFSLLSSNIFKIHIIQPDSKERAVCTLYPILYTTKCIKHLIGACAAVNQFESDILVMKLINSKFLLYLSIGFSLIDISHFQCVQSN